ncbi:hypothetical protein [Nostoc sp.]|uniref:hypothetical protein n=1 Tax=Nostoc sp. TaxID=1180 RepID=UPI002FFBA0D6
MLDYSGGRRQEAPTPLRVGLKQGQHQMLYLSKAQDRTGPFGYRATRLDIIILILVRL